MRCIKKARNLKRKLPAFKHRLVERCRRLCAVIICASMVLGGFPSAFYQALAADDSEEYEYELDRVSIYEALDTAIAEGTTLDNELKFLGDHQEEYDELFTADGTLYELKDLKTDFDSERDKSVGLRVFVRIEGDIALDEAYEVDGSEEVIFLLTNKTDTERYVQIIFDDCATEPISIPAEKDIPVEISNDSIASVSPAAGGGSGADGASDGSIYGDESVDEAEDADTKEDSDEEADIEDDTEAESDSEDAAQDEDKEDTSESDDGKESSDTDSAEKVDSADTSDTGSDAGDDKESSFSDSGSDKADSGDSSGDTDSSNDKDASKDKDKESSDDKASSEGKDTSDKGTSRERKSSRNRESSRDKDSSAERSSSKEKDSSGKDSDKGEKGDKIASVSVNKTALLTASIEIDFDEEDEDVSADVIEEDSIVEIIEIEGDVDAEAEESPQVDDEVDTATEEASPSDATPSDAWYINGTIYDAVRMGKRGAVAYVTTTEEFGLDKISAANTTLTYEGEDYIVTVSYGRDAGLPRGVELTASEYEKDSDTYQIRLAEVAELNEWDKNVLEERIVYNDENDTEGHIESIADYIRLFDISLIKDGAEVEPESEIEVAISYLEAEEPIDMETGYTIIHFGDNEIEAIETETEYQNEDAAQIITFSINGFSDVMVIEDNDYGIMTLGVSASRDYFDFISMDDTLTAHHGSGVFEPDSGVDYIYDNGNYFHLIDEDTKHVQQEHMFDLSLNTLDTDNLPSLFSIVENPDVSQNDHLLCLDISSISGGNNPNADTLDGYVQGNGYTFTNVGTITFENAGTVAGGIPVDVQMTFDKIRLYNCFSAGAKDTSETPLIDCTVPIDQKFHFANFGSGDTAFWISQNYTGNRSDGYHNGYSYPVNLDVSMTINIVYAGTNDTVDMSFLMAASDIDGYQANGRHGYYKETFKTLSGFNGNYYIYPTDADFIASYSNGFVTVQSSDSEENYNGDAAYTKGGIYADSNNGEFQVSYSEGWCGTRVEIYDYTSIDITLEKEDSENSSLLLDGAEFIVYKDVSAGDQDYPYGSGDPEYGKNDPVRIYYSDEKKNGNTVIEAEWSTNEDDAKKFKSGDDEEGQVIIRCLYPSENYYFKEVSPPDGGYMLLKDPIKFQVTSYGSVVLETDNEYVTLDPDDPYHLTIIVENAIGKELPNTGGPGDQPFRSAGLLISGSALWLLYITLRRRRRWLVS